MVVGSPHHDRWRARRRPRNVSYVVPGRAGCQVTVRADEDEFAGTGRVDSLEFALTVEDPDAVGARESVHVQVMRVDENGQKGSLLSNAIRFRWGPQTGAAGEGEQVASEIG